MRGPGAKKLFYNFWQLQLLRVEVIENSRLFRKYMRGPGIEPGTSRVFNYDIYGSERLYHLTTHA